MRILLMQHGHALAAEEDPDRPLSGEGRREAAVIAGFLAGSDVRPVRIWHSPKTRARQTAEILAQALGQLPLQAQAGLAPRDPVEPWAERLGALREEILIVGHMPHLGRLAGALVLSAPAREVIQFTPGSLACLEREERGGPEGWLIAWLVTPGMLG